MKTTDYYTPILSGDNRMIPAPHTTIDTRAKALELAVRLAASGQVSFYVDSPSYGTVKVARIFEEYLKGEAK